MFDTHLSPSSFKMDEKKVFFKIFMLYETDNVNSKYFKEPLNLTIVALTSSKYFFPTSTNLNFHFN